MGSPISVVLSELTMQKIEQQIFINPPCTPLFWLRYIDDCFTALPNNRQQEFLRFINSINRNIQFTSESEQDHEILFLDMLIKRKENNPTLTFGIYKKPTNSGRHLDFKSYHHQRHKKNVVAAHRHRANKICSPEEMKKENDKNNYPWTNSRKPRNSPSICRNPVYQRCIRTCWKIIKKHNILLSNKSTNSLRNQLCNLKDKRSKEEM